MAERYPSAQTCNGSGPRTPILARSYGAARRGRTDDSIRLRASIPRFTACIRRGVHRCYSLTYAWRQVAIRARHYPEMPAMKLRSSLTLFEAAIQLRCSPRSSLAILRANAMPRHWKYWIGEPNSQLLQPSSDISAAGALRGQIERQSRQVETKAQRNPARRFIAQPCCPVRRGRGKRTSP